MPVVVNKEITFREAGIPVNMQAGSDAATLLHAQSAVDYTEYPGGGVLYMDLPVTKGPLGDALFVSVIQNFLPKWRKYYGLQCH